MLTKQLKLESNDFWDIKRTVSYNCLLNFIIGIRGAGKTYTSLKYGIEEHLKYKRKGIPYQFIYLRRFNTELEKLTTMRGGRIFNTIIRNKEFPTHDLKAESNILICDKEKMGYAVALNTASILKSDSFPDVNLIIFDEFIIDPRGAYHYLKDEVTKFFDLYETIARGRSIPVFFLSNAVTVTNPYFDYFHLDKPYNTDIQRFGKTKDILVEFTAPPKVEEAKKLSRFGQIIEDSEYSEYAYENKWLLDNMDFIEKKTQRSNYFCSIRYNETWMGIWFDPVQWIYYVSLDADLQCPRQYSATTDDHKPNVLLFKAGKKIGALNSLITAYECGAIRYENLKLKNWFRDIMRMRNQ